MLADEMGLGKTAQIIATLSQLSRQHKVTGPYLVVAPLSTIGHWSREFAAWSDLRTLTLHGSAADRQVLLKYLWHGQNDDNEEDRSGSRKRKATKADGYWFEVVVTTYETLLLEESR